MQNIALTLTTLFLIIGGLGDAALEKLGVRKRTAVSFLLVFGICELIPQQVQIGTLLVRPFDFLPQLVLMLFMLLRTAKGWERYRSVLCICLLGVFVFYFAKNYYEDTDRILF